MQDGYEIRRPWLIKCKKLAYSMEMMFEAVHSKNEKSSLCCSERINSSLSVALIFHTLIRIREKRQSDTLKFLNVKKMAIVKFLWVKHKRSLMKK